MRKYIKYLIPILIETIGFLQNIVGYVVFSKDEQTNEIFSKAFIAGGFIVLLIFTIRDIYINDKEGNLKYRWIEFCREYKGKYAVLDMSIMDGEDYSLHITTLPHRFTEKEIKILLEKELLSESDYRLSKMYRRNVDEYKKIYDSYYEDCRVNNELYPKRIGNAYFNWNRFSYYRDYLKEHIVNDKIFEKESPVD